MLSIIIMVFALAFSVETQAQGPSKKCPTCGLSMAKCQYKGKHPKPAPTPTEKKCATCGKPVSKCQYGGSHPKCSTCGEVIDNCQYHGNHPKCATCGKLLNACEYHGNHPKPTSGNINGHDWVDLGLSVKWATCNVGASKPEDYGGYYAWGETSTKSEYTWGNCFDCFDDSGDSRSVYKIGGKTKLEPNSGHDTARQNWGGSWRMPTIKELGELNSKCTWKWTTKGGHNGYVVTGPNGNMIFLPAAGFRYDTSSYYVGEYGEYWSSTLSSSNSSGAQRLNFESTHDTGDSYRSFGFSVRPVTD
ncbi:MAG: hypothetical protein Q4E60_07675 [Bacteroidales bacterium]|nr:hypothetical protein [Bacteroidales bacterium]